MNAFRFLRILAGILICPGLWLTWPSHLAAADTAPQTMLAHVTQMATDGDAEAQHNLGNHYLSDSTRNTTRALTWLTKAATQNYVESQAILATLYAEGTMVERDLALAAKWAQRAAVNGDVSSMALLGTMYYSGQGVPKDLEAAAKWLIPAAKKGSVRAKYILGWMYAEGAGVAHDEGAATASFLEAAQGGDERAFGPIAERLLKGIGIDQHLPGAASWLTMIARRGLDGSANAAFVAGEIYRTVIKDFHAALEMYVIAAASGNADAQFWAGELEAVGTGTAKDQDYERARKHYGQAAAHNHERAMAGLARLYHKGLGGPTDWDAAVELFTKAVAAGDTRAKAGLGEMYYNGDGVKQDYVKARELLEEPATTSNDYPDAQFCYGLMLANGEGGEKNTALSTQLIVKAAEHGIATAQWIVGEYFLAGVPFAKDPVKAVEWLRKAAEQDSEPAAWRLGEAYATGTGIDRDVALAIEWYRIASKRGSVPATKALEDLSAEATAALPGAVRVQIMANLRLISEASEAYLRRTGETTVKPWQDVVTLADQFDPIAGEDYSPLAITKGNQILKVETASLAVVEYNPNDPHKRDLTEEHARRRRESTPPPSPPPSITDQILSNLRMLGAAADQYFLEMGVSEVNTRDLIGPGKTLRRVESIDGESYDNMVIAQGVDISVTRRNGTKIVFKNQ